MRYSFVECQGGRMQTFNYDDEGLALGFALKRFREKAFCEYWSKLYLVEGRDYVEVFSSKEAWALVDLYFAKRKLGEDMARGWVRDEILTFNPHKIRLYTKLMEAYYG